MEIVMPKMGESINEGTIIKWHKKKGDHVKRDEIIFEISTDKVDTEVPSPSEGIITDIKVNEGDTVEVGTVVALIDEKEGATAAPQEKPAEKKTVPEKTKEEQEEIVEERVSETGQTEDKPEPAAAESSSEEPTNTVSSSEDKVEVLMPKMGESVMEGTIIKWHKKPGDKVKKDEILFEISTDKVDTEVPSPAAGTLSEIRVEENETVEVGTVVAVLGSAEGKVEVQTEKQVKEDKKDQQEKEDVKEVSEPQSMHDNFSGQSVPEETKRDKGFLSPLVMNIARQENVSFDELDRIKGTGVGNRITKKDILGYIEQRSAKKEEKSAPVQQKTEEKPAVKPEEKREYAAQRTTTESTGDVEKIPMDNIRQKIMQHMVNSRDTSVHVSAMLEVDMTKIHNFLQKNRDKYQRDGIKLTYMPFIAQAAVKALQEYPLVNSSIEGNTILRKKYINLGIAVAIEPNGLIVPNIKNAEDKNIIGLSKAISEIANKARTKKLTPDDITGGTFTITNYGVFGLNFGTPIINQPEVAILGVGTVLKKPVVVEYDGNDIIAIKPIMALTISHDHRLIDGMLGGLFVKYIKETLENFDPESI
jgi:pyruvate dehydrogenase E2 component (dihydrolipoamide acetyltransferase)